MNLKSNMSLSNVRKFRERALVQNCQVYKRRDVLSLLPPDIKAGVEARIKEAYNMATKSLERTKKYLEEIGRKL